MRKYTVKQVVKKERRFDKIDFFNNHRDEDQDWLMPALLSMAVGGSAGVSHIESLINDPRVLATNDYFGIVMWGALLAFGLGKTLAILWNTYKEDVLFDKMRDKLNAIYKNQGYEFEEQVKAALSNGR